SVNKPVEFRPYIKDIAGRRRLFFLGTVSAVKADSQKFDGSATPDLALVDSEYRNVIWIDVKHPSQWDQTVYEALNEAWRASEGIGYYYDNNTQSSDLDVKRVIDSILSIPKINTNTDEIEKLQRQIDSLKSVGN